MKIGLVNGSHQSNKNELVFNRLKTVTDKYGHELYNFGAYDEKNELTYIQSGILTALLLNSGAVDFVVSGCSTGQGIVLVTNSFPNVICGHIENEFDAYAFMQINDGNAISMPFLDDYNVDFELIFENLFKEKSGNGFPQERAEIQKKNRIILNELKNKTYRNFIDILKDIPNDLLKGIMDSEGFKKYFFELSKDEEINEYLRGIYE